MSRAGAALALAATITCALACKDDRARQAGALTGGDPAKGKVAISGRGCGTCHEIPGVAGATGRVGPPLAGIARRAILAGRLPNGAENLVRWIRDPRGVDPATAMPDLGIEEAEARDIAAYLYTLR